MTKISPELLSDTYNLVQLARETALARGKTEQAERLTPVANNLKGLVETARLPKPTNAESSLMNQPDFKALLSAVQSTPRSGNSTISSLERNQVVVSMSSAGMPEMDIARHMGITREEIRMILSLDQARRASSQVVK